MGMEGYEGYQDPKPLPEQIASYIVNNEKIQPVLVVVFGTKGEEIKYAPAEYIEPAKLPADSEFDPAKLKAAHWTLSHYDDQDDALQALGLCRCFACNRYGCGWVPCVCPSADTV